jgi:quinol monooxygenase YgiN
MNIRPVHVITLAEALPKHIEEVRQILRDMAELHRQEEGCLRFDVYADRKAPTRLNTIEVWVSREAHQRHLDSTLVAKSIMLLFGKVRGVPEVRVLDTISEMEE